ncbi:hypothetical protein M0811_06664 [Anaeramoeba ignava]|uniref:Uncharacterized protein n=1 Tax=Anaeramoeba ignava TaxID=1746090 RepID=A0A9Q0LN14_ANAIG|nr:hypothetical protein M0811_06664 [Anaeramoeba ignava]
MVAEEVSREFQMDYIYFDTFAAILWLITLIILRKKLPLIFSFIGVTFYYFIDFVIWHEWRKTRHTTGPVKPALLMLWVSTLPGVVHPSWAILMLEYTFPKRNCPIKSLEDRTRYRILWTLYFFGVQTIPAFMQNGFSWDNRTVTITRTMTGNRWLMLLSVVLGYSYLTWRKIPPKVLLKLFFIGFVTEGMFEFALYISGIRPTRLDVLLVDSAVEFNVGMPWIFLMWRWTISPQMRPFYDPKYTLPCFNPKHIEEDEPWQTIN